MKIKTNKEQTITLLGRAGFKDDVSEQIVDLMIENGFKPTCNPKLRADDSAEWDDELSKQDCYI